MITQKNALPQTRQCVSVCRKSVILNEVKDL